jgi:hypothetical protein
MVMAPTPEVKRFPAETPRPPAHPSTLPDQEFLSQPK